MSAAREHDSPRPHRGWAERGLAIAAAVLGMLVVGVLVVAGLLLVWPRRSATGTKAVRVVVAQGESTAAISRTLARSGVIGNAGLFQVRARLAGADGKLKPGDYQLALGMSDADAIATLERGSSAAYVDVTIPEGFTIDQIAARMQSEADVPAAEFLRLAKTGAPQFAEKHPYLRGAYNGSLEGYLFPQTYRVPMGSAPRQVIELMLDQFDAQIPKVDLTAARQQGLDLQQVVTLASMIERESKLARERPLVSSVIYNRLARHMNLEIDATIQYVLPTNKIRLSGADIHLATPYNTYTRPGLPPGPVSNPGLASLQAAAHPAATEYLYYVLTGKDGSHTFATNKADFLVAKKKSIEVFGR